MPGSGCSMSVWGVSEDLNWFDAYLLSTNGVYIIHNDLRPPIPVHLDVCVTSAGAICRWDAYHTEFTPHIIRADHPICHLEAVNAGAVLRTWDPQLKGNLVHLFMDMPRQQQYFN